MREHRFTERQIEAALYDQLVKTERDEDDHDAFRINGPDFSGSISTLDKYGAWRNELREAQVHMKNLPLLDAIESTDPDDQDEVE